MIVTVLVVVLFAVLFAAAGIYLLSSSQIWERLLGIMFLVGSTIAFAWAGQLWTTLLK